MRVISRNQGYYFDAAPQGAIKLMSAGTKTRENVMDLFKTRNPLSAEVRLGVIEMLNERMADILDLHYQTLLAHWNVRGQNFIGLHKLLDDFAGSNGADNWCDWVAERISQLGGTVLTTIPYIAEHTSLATYPTDISAQEEHVSHLMDNVARVIVAFKEASEAAAEMGDGVTADILGDVQRSAEKYLWLFEAHVQA